MKREQLLVVLSGAAAVATGMMSLALITSSAAISKSEAEAMARRATPTAESVLRAGVALQEARDFPAAAQLYRVVLKLDPRNKLAWYNLGVIAHEEGRTADARTAYEKTLKIDPAFQSALYNQAVLLKSSDPDRAMGLLERAVGVDPDAATAHLHLGDIWAGKRRDREAAEEFRTAVAADPSLRSHVPEPFRHSLRPAPEPVPTLAGSNR